MDAAETKAMFQVSKRACAFKKFLTSANLDPIINTLPHIYTDNRATIGLIKSNKLTFPSRHLDIPIAFTHEQYTLGFYTINHIASKLNAADTSIKACTGPIHQHHGQFIRGYRFCPSDDTPHGKYIRFPSTALIVLSTGK